MAAHLLKRHPPGALTQHLQVASPITDCSTADGVIRGGNPRIPERHSQLAKVSYRRGRTSEMREKGPSCECAHI